MTGSGRLIGVGQRTIELLWAPISRSDVANAGDRIKLSDYDHVSILVHIGAMASGLDADLTITASTDDGTTGATVLDVIKYRKKVLAGDWGEMTSVTDSKIDIAAGGEVVPVTDNGTLLCIEIDTADIKGLSSTYDLDWLTVAIGQGGAYAYVSSAIAVFSKGRFMTDPPLSQLA